MTSILKAYVDAQSAITPETIQIWLMSYFGYIPEAHWYPL